MTITKIESGKDITLKISGWLDTLTSPELGKEMDKIDSFTSLTFDFDELDYVSSSGLREIVSAYKKSKSINADFCVINANADVMNVFKITDLTSFMDIKAK